VNERSVRVALLSKIMHSRVRPWWCSSRSKRSFREHDLGVEPLKQDHAHGMIGSEPLEEAGTGQIVSVILISVPWLKITLTKCANPRQWVPRLPHI